MFSNGHVIYDHGFIDNFIFRNVRLFHCFSVKILARLYPHSIKKQRMKRSKSKRVECDGLLRSALLGRCLKAGIELPFVLWPRGAR